MIGSPTTIIKLLVCGFKIEFTCIISAMDDMKNGGLSCSIDVEFGLRSKLGI